MNLNIRVKQKDKEDISKIFIGVIILNVLMAILMLIFGNVSIVKNIIIYLVSVIYIVIAVYIIKKENTEEIEVKEFNSKYDPILTRFFIKNEFVLDDELLNAEICYLIRKGYIETDKENNILRLKDRTKFKQIEAIEKIDNNKIEEYSSDEIPSYENLFIGKILFAFHNEIDLNEFKKNQKENYYLNRGEMYKLVMEKMLLFEVEKKNMIGEKSNLGPVFIEAILNIITSIILFVVTASLNVVLLLATIINVLLSAVIIKNENVLSYKYTKDIIEYIDNLLEYIKVLRNEKVTSSNNSSQDNEESTDEELKLLFGIKNDKDD